MDCAEDLPEVAYIIDKLNKEFDEVQQENIRLKNQIKKLMNDNIALCIKKRLQKEEYFDNYQCMQLDIDDLEKIINVNDINIQEYYDAWYGPPRTDPH